MHNFMIGLYGGFDEEKYKRDFRKGIYGAREDRSLF